MRGAHQGVPVAAPARPAAGGVFSGLFGGNAPARQTDGMAPRRKPPATRRTAA